MCAHALGGRTRGSCGVDGRQAVIVNVNVVVCVRESEGRSAIHRHGVP